MKRIYAAYTSLLITAFFYPACSADVVSVLQKPDSRFGETEILNYEYTNRYYIDDIRRNHFLINIEIEKPLIINVRLPEMDPVYMDSPITGSAIVLMTSDRNGKIINYKFIKKAGLGLDAYVEKMIPKIEIKPIRHRGERGPSVFSARFVFTESR